MKTPLHYSRFTVLTGLLTLTLLVAMAGLALFAAESPNQGEKKAEKKAEVFALVLVSPKQPLILDEENAKVDWNEFFQFLNTQAALLKTRVVLRAALDSPKVSQLKVVKQQKESVAWLEGLVQVQVNKQTGILQVTVPVGALEEQVVLTNAVVEAYLTQVDNKDQAPRRARLEKLKKLHAEYDLQLREKRHTLRELARDLVSKDAKLHQLKQEFALKELATVQGELLLVRSQIRQAKIEVAQAKKKDKLPDAPVSAKELEDALAKNQVVMLLLTEIGQLETTVTTLKRLLANPEKDTGYLKSFERLEGAKKDITILREKMRPVVAKQLRERHRMEQEMQRETAEQRVSLLTVAEELLRTELENRTENALAFHRKTEDLEWLKDEITHVEDTARKIGRQIQMLQVEIQAPPRVIMLQKAELPGK